MEITCPHCKKPGITSMAKFRAVPKSPAKCSYCGGLSAIEQGVKIKVVLFVAFILMLVGPAIYAFVYTSLLFMLFPLIVIFLPNLFSISAAVFSTFNDKPNSAEYLGINITGSIAGTFKHNSLNKIR